MFVFKNKYFLIIENIKDIDLKNIKNNNKINNLQEKNKIIEKIKNLMKFRMECKSKNLNYM